MNEGGGGRKKSSPETLMNTIFDVDNKTIRNLLQRRTIREFKDEPLDDALLARLFEAVNRTASSTGMQQYSMIRVKDEAVRKALADVAGQEYLARAPELVIFIVDLYRNNKIAALKGESVVAGNTMDAFFQGFSDAILAAQTLTTAVEASGLGAVYFGSILNDPGRVIEILKLPTLTFPALGVGFGKINQEPMLKPRMPLSEKLFTDTYEKLEIDTEALARYDAEMETYYDLRHMNRRVDSFSKQVVTRLNTVAKKRQRMLDYIAAQGFVLKPEA